MALALQLESPLGLLLHLFMDVHVALRKILQLVVLQSLLQLMLESLLCVKR